MNKKMIDRRHEFIINNGSITWTNNKICDSSVEIHVQSCTQSPSKLYIPACDALTFVFEVELAKWFHLSTCEVSNVDHKSTSAFYSMQKQGARYNCGDCDGGMFDLFDKSNWYTGLLKFYDESIGDKKDYACICYGHLVDLARTFCQDVDWIDWEEENNVVFFC